ncbi:hypothetical protein DYQ86_26975 [Acidobacteria bacterium AB60]|nr:hypothetical protein DYQ86_26975 [Acidobacteria bacterium AB60]
MTGSRRLRLPSFLLGLAAILTLAASLPAFAQPDPAANAGFDAYTRTLETRLAEQHRNVANFIAPVNLPDAGARLRKGEFLIENLTPNPPLELPGALLFHWRGTAFVPGATAADVGRLLQDFDAYPRYFAPQVLQASVLSREGDHLVAQMRVRQKHVITVVLDTTYDITFAHLDAQHGYSLSRSTQISEIEDAGTPKEHALPPEKEHGFLWRLNTYWTREERDGGLYLQIESVSLTRSIPSGLGWIVRPFVESIPRESLEFTLHSAVNALRKQDAPPEVSAPPTPKS